jgi:hypothetical protein
MFYWVIKVERTIFDKANEGESPIYVGIKYLEIIALQINEIRLASKNAWILQDYAFQINWLNEMRIFWDLVENRTGLEYSDKKIKIHKLNFDTMKKEETEILEKDKYDSIFDDIEKMIENNASKIKVEAINKFSSPFYKANKLVLKELSNCMRELFRDANRRNLIMPRGLEDPKSSLRNEWLDRDKVKNLYGEEDE